MESSAADGWHPDPTLRFELRYYNGASWTADVSSHGQRFVDPLGVEPGAGATNPGTGARNAIATAALVFGIIGLATGWLPFVFVLGAIAAVLALVFGLIGRRRSKITGTGGGFATAGLIMGAVGVLMCVAGFVFTTTFIEAMDDYDSPSPHQAQIVSCLRDEATHTAEVAITNVDEVPATFAIRVDFVRSGTDNVQRQALVEVDDVQPGETVRYSVSRRVEIDNISCVIREVHGPLPFGVDPGI